MNDQSTALEADTVAVTNLAVLRGCVRSEPVTRVLPSGVTVLQFDLTTTITGDGRTSTISVPVAWTDPSSVAAGLVTEGAELVVVGLSLIHISEPTRLNSTSRMPSSA